jgi:hypothetical protein
MITAVSTMGHALRMLSCVSCIIRYSEIVFSSEMSFGN